MATPADRSLRALLRLDGLTISPLEIVAATAATASLLALHRAFLDVTSWPLFAAPLAASLAILFTTPGMGAARSWNVIAGQTLSAAVSVGVLLVIGDAYDGMVAAPVALGLALLAMRLLRCLHPPACATVMVICLAPATAEPLFILFPVLTGSM
ncbi:MAG: hypothetical protein RL190_309, partial [Actinomycetota bacterium]